MDVEPSPPRLAVFLSFSGHGGVERMMVNLITGFVAAGVKVDLLLIKQRGPHLDALPGEVNIIRLGSEHTLLCLWPLVRYLRCYRPQALLAAKDRANKVAILARWLAGTSTRLVVRLGTTLSGALQGRSRLKRWLWYASQRRFYPWADAIVAVSHGVAEDTARITGLPVEGIHVIPNPVVTEALLRGADEFLDHPWFQPDGTPVIVAAGRLTQQKDFASLIRAFDKVQAETNCRLMILGEGSLRGQLEALVAKLGLEDKVAFPGFARNLASFLSRATLFVLSSRWEGSPNVLTEALALGVPVVATDCPSGPREILQDGQFGPLVPVGDVPALTQAILETLRQPLDAVVLQSASKDYTQENSAAKYLELLELAPCK